MCFTNEDGLFSLDLKLKGRNKNKFAKKFTQIWNKYIVNLNIGYGGRIALSTLSDGLYEYNTKDNYEYIDRKIDNINVGKIYKLSDNHSTASSWAFSSLANSSYLNGNCLIGFRYIEDNTQIDDSGTDKYNYKRYKLIHVKDFSLSDI